MHRDGIDTLWPTVEAQSIEEVMQLATPQTTFRLPDGSEITFGSAVVVASAYYERPGFWRHFRSWFQRSNHRA